MDGIEKTYLIYIFKRSLLSAVWEELKGGEGRRVYN